MPEPCDCPEPCASDFAHAIRATAERVEGDAWIVRRVAAFLEELAGEAEHLGATDGGTFDAREEIMTRYRAELEERGKRAIALRERHAARMG